MTFYDVIDYYGSVRAASDRLGVAISTVYSWKRSGICYRSQRQIEADTRGKLRCVAIAGVPASKHSNATEA